MTDTPQTDNKQEFVKWLKSYNEKLRSQNEKSKHRIEINKRKNTELSKQIEDFYQNSSRSLTPLGSSFLATQQVAQTTMEACDKHITSKLEQIRKGNQEIEIRMKEETERSQNALYEIMNKDEVGLKPYVEVVAATEQLQKDTEILVQQCEEAKQQASITKEKLNMEYKHLLGDIKNLEIVFKDLKLQISSWGKKRDDQLFTLNLNAANDVMNSTEIENLSKEISELENKLSGLQERTNQKDK
ncbi:uncharacterized protein [Musca autumnalis]|uniref:uncharacterized protein n=1 Tax=Musca autumnalis TaxID=221902 RepID=UPI003CEED1A0